MKRILTTTLALSVLVLPACKGGASADAVKLVPDDAEFIVGMSPKAIGSSELYKKFSSELDDEEFKETMSAFEDCKLKPLEFDAIVAGFDQGGEFVVVVAGDGVGKQDQATCVIKAMQKQNGEKEEADVVKEGGKNVINMSDKRAYLLNDNTIVFASSAWKDSVAKLIDGEGKAAVDNSKKDALGKVDTKKPVWFVADVPSDMAAMAAMVGQELTEVKSVVGSVDLSKGMALDLVAGFESSDKAKAAADKVNGLFNDVKGDVPDDLKRMVDSVKIDASGSDVKISVAASMDDIDAAKKLAPL
jgi:hypothetical protein